MDEKKSRWSGARLRHAADSGLMDPTKGIWVALTSVAITWSEGSRTASMSEKPTLPAAALARPSARKIASSINVVVVLPLVPVTHSQGAGDSARRMRQATSSSPHTGIDRSSALTMTGSRGLIPGETTSTSASSAAESRHPRRTSAPRTSRMAPFSRRRSSSPESMTVTSAPTDKRASAAANPAMPMPATVARSPAQSEVDEVSAARSRVMHAPTRRRRW